MNTDFGSGIRFGAGARPLEKGTAGSPVSFMGGGDESQTFAARVRGPVRRRLIQQGDGSRARGRRLHVMDANPTACLAVENQRGVPPYGSQMPQSDACKESEPESLSNVPDHFGLGVVERIPGFPAGRAVTAGRHGPQPGKHGGHFGRQVPGDGGRGGMVSGSGHF